MATRAETIARELRDWNENHKPAATTHHAPWYLSDTLWDAVITAAEVLAEIASSLGRPIVARTVTATTVALRHRVIPKEDMSAWLKCKLQAIYKIVENTPQDDKLAHARLDAQVELILELLKGNEDE